MPYIDDVKYLKGVGPAKAQLLLKLNITTVGGLLNHYPANYLDISSPVSIEDAVLDETNIIAATVVSKKPPAMIRKGMTIYKLTVTDGVSDMQVTIYNSKYLFDSLKIGESYILCGKVTGNFTLREMSSPQVLKLSSDSILPIYPLTEGINQRFMRDTMKKALETVDKSYETLDNATLENLGLVSVRDALFGIHFPKSQSDIALARRRLAFDELLTLQLGMKYLREKNRQSTGYVMKPLSIDDYYRALPYDLTGAQKRAISECLSDMREQTPMNRLILGDVGSGKTAVAAACCYFAAKNGTQSVLMAPTEILANQHYDTLCEYLAPLGVKVALLTGSLTAKAKAQMRDQIRAGDYDVIVGTHALFQQSTEFNNLGLVITDEQHRFGVDQRARLADKGNNPHKLVMSATPIPRTLALMIYGELDISFLDELPKGRKKIETYAVTGKLRQRAYSFIKDRIAEGRQAYIVCPAIEETLDEKSVLEYAKHISENEFKNYRIGVLHGKMPADKKESVMQAFKNDDYDILVATTVVEVGVDVANAAVMMIEDADRFGLSQLHQLRGRVGRSEHQSYCILVTDNVTEQSKKRLKILSSTSDGFAISEADLEMRGPGDFFGNAQHGLPRLKIADLAADSQLLRLAQETAEKIYSSQRITPALKDRVKSLLSGGIIG